MRRLAAWESVREGFRGVLSEPRALADALRGYAADHMGFRNLLIRVYSIAMVEGVGVSSTDKVALGTEGWAFRTNEDEPGGTLGAHRYEPHELAYLVGVIEERERWFAARGVRYLLTAAPDKKSLYPERVPPNVRWLGRPSRLDQLARALVRRGQVRFVDLRPALLAAKAEGPVYDRMGTHWNDWGAYVAYRELMHAAREWFPQIEILPRHGYRRLRRPGGDVILLSMLGLDGRDFPETLVFEPRFETRAVEAKSGQALSEYTLKLRAPLTSLQPAASGPFAVVVGDSFGDKLMPFLSETFVQVHYEWPASLALSRWLRAMIKRDRPALVIHEFAESTLERPAERFRAFGRLKDPP